MLWMIFFHRLQNNKSAFPTQNKDGFVLLQKLNGNLLLQWFICSIVVQALQEQRQAEVQKPGKEKV